MKAKSCIISLLLALSIPAWGSVYNYGTLNGDPAIGGIPDNSTIGLSDAHTLSGLGTSLSDVTLTFVLQGGFSTDLSGYLRLGNLSGSTAYDLTSFTQGQTLSEGSPTTYSIDLGSTFTAQNPNDTWTLFFVDQSPGGSTTLNGWSLDITAVPEPVNVALGIFAVLLGLWRCIGMCRPRPAAK